ncbi:hypothetical protein [Kingella denitrificans]|uniref:hypothetical protein n=1 Tax=Kingella denitrificans TaxID=502 RepID=UPI00164A82A8|nr:hypothetical protein [Kingella denitrificans]
MRQGGEPQGVQVVRQGEPTPYHCDFNSLYFSGYVKRCVAMEKAACMAFFNVQAAFFG